MKRPKETTYQVVLDALSFTTCYPAFLITAEVPVIYMHQFWDTVYKHGSLYRFKIDNKKFAMNVEEFKEILDICPRVEEIKYLTDITIDHLHQPWRAFAAIINKCLFGKVSGLDKMRLSRIQILWGMFYKKNVDFVDLIWEDLAYQIVNKDAKRSDKMYYPRFTKTIINHYLSKNPSILMRNKMFMHTARDDTILGILKFVSKNEDVHVYGTLMPKEMTNPEMLSSESFQTYYAIATGAEAPKSKKQRKADFSKSFEETPTRKSPRIKRSTKVSPAKSKKKAPAKADTGKSFHSSQSSGSGTGIDEGTGTKPGVPDVPKQDSESEAESWGDSDDEDDDNEDESNNDGNDDDDNDGDDDDNDDNVDDDDDDESDDNDDERDASADDDDDKNKEEEEENADERVPTPEDMDFSDKEDNKEKNEKC
ncbi:hypothetical protein Tco_1247340 [Tanacetum coccineum]